MDARPRMCCLFWTEIESLRAADVHGNGVATAQTQRDDARPSLKTAHHAEHGDQTPRSAGPQGVTEADGPAVEVESLVRYAQLLGDGARGGGKGFVVFVDVHVQNLEVVSLQQGVYRWNGRTHHTLGLDT